MNIIHTLTAQMRLLKHKKVFESRKNSVDELQNKIALFSVYKNKKSKLNCYIKNKFG